MLIHGVGGSKRSWDPVGLDGAIDLPSLVHPAALAAGIQPSSPTVVIGHSLGGMVAQELALTPDSQVKAMVLCCTIPGATPRVRQLNDVAAAYVESNGSRAYGTRMAPHLLGPDAPPELRSWFIEETAQADPLLIGAQLRAIGGWTLATV
jgi:pimeloyl-ACP methyl ester carboxylesterase